MLGDDELELEERSIASYGLDSMIDTEMRTWLFKEFGLDFPFRKLLAQTLMFSLTIDTRVTMLFGGPLDIYFVPLCTLQPTTRLLANLPLDWVKPATA